MRHGSLFSGIGGFDLAAEWMGWRNVFHCEWEAFPRRVLNYYWPKSKSYEDIKKTDFTIHRGRIDVLSGGFPCQPFSLAGARKGESDDRYLWPEMLRAIREIEPPYVVGENVAGLVTMDDGRVLEGILTDLEDEGYKTEVFLVPAASTEAVHRRDRIWIIGYNVTYANRGRELHGSGEVSGEDEEIQKRDQSTKSNNTTSEWYATDPSSERRGRGNIGPETDKESEREIHKGERQHRDGVRGEAEGRSTTTTDTESTGFETRDVGQREEKPRRGNESTWSRPEFGYPSEPPVCGPNDALPEELDGVTFSKWRTESLKGYGNAIVPSVVYEIFKGIEKLDFELDCQKREDAIWYGI